MTLVIKKLEKIIETKENLQEKINTKGGNVTNEMPFSQYAEEISNLSTSGIEPMLINFMAAVPYDLVIPRGITKLGAEIFRDSYAKSAYIPDTVIDIGGNLFRTSGYLESVIFEEECTVVGASMFNLCSKLEQVTLPRKISSLTNGVFNGCKKLSNLFIPKNITNISYYALGCGSTDTPLILTMESEVPPTISGAAFDGGVLGEIRVPVNAVEAYKSASNWSNHADIIVGY